MVELACGAALAGCYGDSIQQLVDNGEISLDNGNIVLVVCGGSAVSIDTLIQWKNTLTLYFSHFTVYICILVFQRTSNVIVFSYHFITH